MESEDNQIYRVYSERNYDEGDGIICLEDSVHNICLFHKGNLIDIIITQELGDEEVWNTVVKIDEFKYSLKRQNDYTWFGPEIFTCEERNL